jgi:hypothetical protein
MALKRGKLVIITSGLTVMGVKKPPSGKTLVAFLLLLLVAGCSPTTSLISSLATNLNRQNDLELVCEGAPAFLLIIDSLIADDPENSQLLLKGVQAYAAFDTAADECGRPERSGPLSAKAHSYGLALLREETGITPEMGLPEFSEALQKTNRSKVGPLFWGGYGWALWIAAQNGAPAALADLPRVEELMLRVVALDDTYYRGGAHLFLGIYYGSKPKMYGGKPELAREHFERALAINQRRFLPVQVAYAEYFARPVMNRELYRSLLEEVLAFDLASEPDLTLSNQIAQRRARRLLDSIDDYF